MCKNCSRIIGGILEEVLSMESNKSLRAAVIYCAEAISPEALKAPAYLGTLRQN